MVLDRQLGYDNDLDNFLTPEYNGLHLGDPFLEHNPFLDSRFLLNNGGPDSGFDDFLGARDDGALTLSFATQTSLVSTGLETSSNKAFDSVSGPSLPLGAANDPGFSATATYVSSDFQTQSGPITTPSSPGAHSKDNSNAPNSVIDVKVFQCSECSTTKKKKADLTRHVKEKYLRLYQCQHCSHSSGTSRGLKRHGDTHTRIRRHVCLVQDCAYSCARPDNLKRHMKNVQTGLRLLCVTGRFSKMTFRCV